MKRARWFLILIPCALMLAQDSDLFVKAPPEVDEALRARVDIYYKAFVSGKFRDAFQVVADDAQDDFLAAGKDKYSGCELTKITYSEEFTKAAVVTACKGEYRWRGNRMPVTIPMVSNWKRVDGQWWWYHVHETEVRTPWGVSRVTPENSVGPAQMPSIPDPASLARDILRSVTIDKTEVELKGYELSQAEVHITNQMPGPVTISVEKFPLPGLSFTIDNPEPGKGEKTTIVFAYDPNDPGITCNVCTSKQALPTITMNVRISPTAQIFPVKVNFGVSPEVLKQLPKLPNKN